EAIAEFEKAQLVDDNPEFLGGIGYVYALSGREADAQKALDQLEKLSKQRHVSPCLMVFIHAGLGRTDSALEWMEKAFDERSAWLVYAKVDPKYDNLRSDPRFSDLLRRVGLLPYTGAVSTFPNNSILSLPDSAPPAKRSGCFGPRASPAAWRRRRP